MYIKTLPDDYVEVAIGAEVHRFDSTKVVKVQRDETATRDNGTKYRFLTIVIPLADGEFPETTSHINPH